MPPSAPAIPQLPLTSLDVVLPCYNEAASVERTVAGVLAGCGGLTGCLRVIVVDDGSRDDTAAVAGRLAAADPRVALVQNPMNQGYGGALALGFAATTSDWVFYTDGDGQFDAAQLRSVLEQARGFHAIVGYRRQRREGWRRRLNGWLWSRLVSLVFSFRYRDVDCAFKVFPGEFLRSHAWASRGALISAELLARAGRAGLRVCELPVEHRPRVAGTPTGNSPRVILRAFRELALLSARIRRGSTP